MMNVIWAERKSPFLSQSQLDCLKNTPAINITAGCAHGCLYCYAKGYSTYPGENKIVIYKNIVEKLIIELSRKKIRPRSVYFSPSSDMFQPVQEVLAISHVVLEALFTRGIGVAFLTKGEIPDKTIRLLLNHADKVRAQIGIITADDSVRAVFEPNAASVQKRLLQIRELVAGGIEVEVRIMPILPGLTDAPDSIHQLCQAVASAGVSKVAISTLFIRPAILAALQHHTRDREFVRRLRDYFQVSERLEVHAGHSSVMPVTRTIREQIYTRFSHIATEYDIDVSVCGCMNPDIGGACNIGGTWSEKEVQYSLW